LEKLVAYQNIQSLREYVLVAQDKVCVDIYRRSSEVDWEVDELTYGDSVHLDSVGLTAPIELFYEDVIGSFK
jgi:Uma2 family endonuclease